MVCAGRVRILGPAEICGENTLVGGVDSGTDGIARTAGRYALRVRSGRPS